jgi:NADPH:quinone reductase-like Zn-dependent oxidoreductase
MHVRAAVLHEFGGPSVVRIEEHDDPEPVPTEVRVKVLFGGVNPVDAKVRLGLSVASVMGPLPLRLGWDVVGVVDRLGAGVTRFSEGDLVFGMPHFPRSAGSHAELMTAPSRQLSAVPAGMDLATAATVPLPATTAWQLVADVASVEASQRVLVLGASGSVGTFVVQMCRERGATVEATSSPARHAWLEQLGVDRCWDSHGEAWSEASRDIDVVIDLAGGSRSEGMWTRVKPDGLVVSVPSGAQSDSVERARLLGVRSTTFIVEPDRVAMDAVSDLLGRGRLQVPSFETFGLDQLPRVHEYLDEGSPLGKMVLAIA